MSKKGNTQNQQKVSKSYKIGHNRICFGCKQPITHDETPVLFNKQEYHEDCVSTPYVEEISAIAFEHRI